MNRGDGDVGRVGFCFGRDQPAGQQRAGQSFRLRWEGQHQAFVECPNSVGNGPHISLLGFFHHEDGNV